MEPFEMIAAPFTVWIAEEGTAFPLPSVDPDASWTLLGTSGTKSMHEDGVQVFHPTTIERDAFRTLGTTGARKAARVSEDLIIEFTLVDLTLEMYAEAIAIGEYMDGGGDPVYINAGIRHIGLYRGLNVPVLALLVRGPSPYDEDENMQYEVPRVYQDSQPEPVFAKNAPAGLKFRYVALMNLADEMEEYEGESQFFGRIRAEE